MGRGGEILHPFEISGSEDDNIRIVLVFFGPEGNGIAAVLVVKSELYPLVKGDVYKRQRFVFAALQGR